MFLWKKWVIGKAFGIGNSKFIDCYHAPPGIQPETANPCFKAQRTGEARLDCFADSKVKRAIGPVYYANYYKRGNKFVAIHST